MHAGGFGSIDDRDVCFVSESVLKKVEEERLER